MATVKNISFSRREVKHKKRPGVVSKCKSSRNKSSKHYVKPYRGQGRA